MFQLLSCGDLCGEDEDVLVLLGRYLQSACGVMRGLVLRGLIVLCEREETVSRGQRGEPVPAVWGWVGGLGNTGAWTLLDFAALPLPCASPRSLLGQALGCGTQRERHQ